MKKIKITYIVILLLAMSATACGSTSNRTRATSGTQGGSSTGELPASTQLILGTIKLEGTAQAVTAKQAVELLPLWQTMKVLAASDTAAQQEKDALIAQIQETMTAEQMQAIQGMNLSRQDMASLMQEQGRASGGSQNGNSQNRSSSSNSGRNSGRGGGFFPGGAPPDGGFGGGFGGQGQTLSKEQIATVQAARQANANSISPLLLNAVIEYLQKKAGA